MSLTNNKTHSLNMSAAEFRHEGRMLVDRLAEFIDTLSDKKVTTGAGPADTRSVLGDAPLPEAGEAAGKVLEHAGDLLLNNSLLNGHPRFWGYITSSAAPICALAEMMAACVNANVGAFTLSPMATQIELQTVQWLSELVGYRKGCGGIFVSGGNVANFIGFLAARKKMFGGSIRVKGLPLLPLRQRRLPWGVYMEENRSMPVTRDHCIYCTSSTHTWVQKAADIFGMGTRAIRWIPEDQHHRMDLSALSLQIEKDRQAGHLPFIVIGNAGSVSTGAVDPLHDMAQICQAEGLWFHVDGAYGAPAAALPELREQFHGLREADSVAIDPHKWLYSSIEAGCTLVKDPSTLRDAFSFNPPYYNFSGSADDAPTNFHELGMQNSRGFKALKVWMSLRNTGRSGITEMIRKDIGLSNALALLVNETPQLEMVSQCLSITVFRYIPSDSDSIEASAYLNDLNKALLDALQSRGDVFLSNAVIAGKYCLRACIVNFRTSYADLEILVRTVLEQGALLHRNWKFSRISLNGDH